MSIKGTMGYCDSTVVNIISAIGQQIDSRTISAKKPGSLLRKWVNRRPCVLLRNVVVGRRVSINAVKVNRFLVNGFADLAKKRATMTIN